MPRGRPRKASCDKVTKRKSSKGLASGGVGGLDQVIADGVSMHCRSRGAPLDVRKLAVLVSTLMARKDAGMPMPAPWYLKAGDSDVRAVLTSIRWQYAPPRPRDREWRQVLREMISAGFSRKNIQKVRQGWNATPDRHKMPARATVARYINTALEIVERITRHY